MSCESRHCLKLSRQRALAIQRFPWKRIIVTTVFWVGEEAGANNPCRTTEVPGTPNWTGNYGGLDNPIRRRDATIFRWHFPPPDILLFVRCRTTMSRTASLTEAPLVIHGSNRTYTGPGQSVCKDRWVANSKGNRTCYAQWEDCGPFRTDHFQYVFQNERPKPI